MDCFIRAGMDARRHAFDGISSPTFDTRIVNIE
jgi:hypothetical protein